MSESAELEPWQQRIIDGFKPGTMNVIYAGRNVGKSYMSSSAFKRLFDDIYSRPVEDLVLSEGTVYGSRYYTVEPMGGNWPEMEHWCLATFGDTGSLWKETKNFTPEPLQRWYANNRKFWFKEERDRDWFVVRWRS